MSSPVRSSRRAWVLVSLAAVAALATAVLLGLLVAALLSGRGAGVAAAYGVAAAGTAVLAVGLLVLARAGALLPSDPARARTLCTRCVVGVLFAEVVLLVAGGVAVVVTRSGTPGSGAAVAAFLLVPLFGLAVWLRAAADPDRRPSQPPRRSGGGGESEPDRAAGAR